LTQQAMLEELEAVAVALAVKVSYEAIAASVGSGGLCRVRGEYRVIIDKRTQLSERVAALAQALAQLPALAPLAGAAGDAPVGAAGSPTASMELSPPVRHLLRHYALRSAS
jgi:hypothetical protein